MHRITHVVEALHAALDSAADANPAFMTVPEKKSALLRLKRVEARVTELLLRVEAEAGDLAAAECSQDVSGVLVSAGLDDPKHAIWEARFATKLARYEQVRAGMAAGDFTEAHATVIVQTLQELPDDAGQHLVAKAELQLCGWARQFAPREVRRLGKRILSTVDPDAGEAAEARALRRLEEESKRRTTLSIRSRGDGTSELRAILTDATAVRLNTVLEAFAQPRKAALEADGRTSPRGRLMAAALASLLERVDPDDLPAHGGDATTVIVTMSLESLRSDLGLATMGDGTLITASEARRLACGASIIPAVFGGKSEILDLGRGKRLFSAGQHKAMGIRDQHCRAEGCTVPATWCEAHHIDPWSRGGRTNIDEGTLLCGHHHHRIHDPKYGSTRLPNGDFRFHLRR